MPSLLYLQTLCSVTYAEHEGNPVLSGLGVGAQLQGRREGLHNCLLHTGQRLQAP